MRRRPTQERGLRAPRWSCRLDAAAQLGGGGCSRVRWALMLWLAIGCDTGGPVREWTPQDHEGEQRAAGQVSATAETEDATLIEVTWRQNCAVCHGLSGRGDTAQGQMLKVPDLARPEL